MIRIIDDLGAPAAVVAVDQLTLEMAPDWNNWAAYGMTAIGYAGAFLNKGGNFIKNVGVSSLPLTARAIRDQIKGGVTSHAGHRVSFRPSGIRQTVVPEMRDVRVS